MNSNICKSALLCGLICLPSFASTAQAEVTPEQFNLLVTAANTDGGKNFNALVEILLASHPEDAEEIRDIAEQLKPKAPPPPQPTSTSIPVEGTIFSDSGSEQFSQNFLPGWEKEIEVNVLYSTGNSSQKYFGTGTKFEREAGRYHQVATTYFDYNNSNAVTNKRRFGIAYKSDYSISDISYVTGYTSFESDSFGAFNKRFTLNAGYGLRALDNDTFKWSLEAGPALLVTKQLSTEDYDKDITAFGGSIFTWIINDRSELDNETKVYAGNKVVIENKTDYKIKVSGALSGKISFDVLYDRDAPIGRKKTETITRVGILYDF